MTHEQTLRAALETIAAFDISEGNVCEVMQYMARDALASTAETAPNAMVFVDAVIVAALDGGDFSGADIQDMAVEHGLLKLFEAKGPCGDPCVCAGVTDFPTECYRTTYRNISPFPQQQEPTK